MWMDNLKELLQQGIYTDSYHKPIWRNPEEKICGHIPALD